MLGAGDDFLLHVFFDGVHQFGCVLGVGQRGPAIEIVDAEVAVITDAVGNCAGLVGAESSGHGSVKYKG